MRVQVISLVSTVIPKVFLTNVPFPIALLPDFEAAPLFKDQPEPGEVWLYDAEVHVELVPDTTLNVPFVVSVNNTSPLLFL